MARSAPIEDATTSSISLIPCLSLLFRLFQIYCLFLHRNFYHLKTILQKFLFECKERMIYRHSGNVFNFSKSQLEIVCLFLLIHFHKGLYLLIIIIHPHQKLLQYPLPSVRFTPLATTLSLDKIFSYLLHSFSSIWYWSTIVPFSKWMTSVQHSIISSKSCVIT